MKIKALTAVSRAIKSFGRIFTLKDSSTLGISGRIFAGQRVDVESSLQNSTVWACVNLLSGTISTLPFTLVREAADGSKQVDKSHPVYQLLKWRPNSDMTAVTFWRIYFCSLFLTGAAYVEKKYTAGKLSSLVFLIPDRVVGRRLQTGSIEWKYNDPVTRQVRNIPEANMWFLPAYTVDGVTPISPISQGARVIGGAMAADAAAMDTFVNGLKAPGVIMTKDFLTPAQRESQRAHFKEVSVNGGVLVMEAGAGFHQLSMNPQDAELLSTRRFSCEEICSWFGVNPTMIGRGSDKNSNWGTGLTQQKQGFVDFCLRQWAVTVEASIREHLLTPIERLSYSAEWNFEGLLRGNATERAQYLATMRDKGLMTGDEARDKENLPKMGGNNAKLIVQSNMILLDKLGESEDSATIAKTSLQNWLKDTEEYSHGNAS